MRPQVVLHPDKPPGVAEELAAIEAIDLLTPQDSDGVHGALLDGASVLVTYKWEDRFLQPSLRWVASESAGFDQFPTHNLEAAGVHLTTATGVHTVSVSEHALALLLALTKRIGESARDAVSHEWNPRPPTELEGLTVAVLGLGTIGEGIAERAACFGMHVIGYKRDPSAYQGRVGEVFGSSQLLDVCRRADVLISVLPGGADTHHLIGAEALDALGAGWLINVGRGSVVHNDALIEALTSGRLRGAGLDVFEPEPLPADSVLWSLTNVVITPHIAGNTSRFAERWARIFCKNLDAFTGRGPWQNRVLGEVRQTESGQE